MDDAQKQAVNKQRKLLIENLDVTNTSILLYEKQVIDHDQHDMLQKMPYERDMRKFLVEKVFKIKNNGWKILIETLNEVDQAWLAEILEKQYEEILENSNGTVSIKGTIPFLPFHSRQRKRHLPLSYKL